MAILEGIQIQNYRALKNITLGKVLDKKQGNNIPLPKLIAIIGENGTGKSSILDALGFIGDCLLEGVEKACDKEHRGGFKKLCSGGGNEPIKFDIRYRENEGFSPINYLLEINIDEYDRPYVSKEVLKHRRKEQQKTGNNYAFVDLKNGKGKVWTGERIERKDNAQERDTRIPWKMADKQSLAISSLGVLADHPRIGLFKNFLAGWYLSYFVPQLARSQQRGGSDPHLNRTGENLSNYLEFINRSKPKEFENMLKVIAKKIPGLINIEPIRAPDQRLLLQFTAEGHKAPFYQQDMSDGTLKMLAYLLLMEDPNPAPLIGIEEPENGLHHQLLEDLVFEFKQFAERKIGSQILLTTHSPNLVDALAPNEVWILSKNSDGFSSLVRSADIEGVTELYNEGIPMGSLWYSNHLTGRKSS